MIKKVGVAILGLGVVGGGTYQILTEKKLESGNYEPCKVCLPNE